MTVTPAADDDKQQHGTKRRADDGLNDEQRFTKRFNLLNIVENQPSKLYIPVDPTADNAPVPEPGPDSMAVDDTPHRVYISDLSAELASIDAAEREHGPKLVFLPDIEAALAAVPPHILRGPATEQGKELVLYATPSTLAEGDVVQKAIGEMKRRAREKMGQPSDEQVETAHGYEYGEYNVQEAAQEMGDEDEDFMDVE